jgi:hypothetical protein
MSETPIKKEYEQPKLVLASSVRISTMLDEESDDLKTLCEKYGENFEFLSQGVFAKTADEKGELYQWWTTEEIVNRINSLYQKDREEIVTKYLALEEKFKDLMSPINLEDIQVTKNFKGDLLKNI